MKLAALCCVLSLVCTAGVGADMLDAMLDYLDHKVEEKRNGCFFRCSNGRCLQKFEMCNHDNQCDGEDEDVATCQRLGVCEFTCPFILMPTMTLCVKAMHLCDEKKMCQGGTDEDVAVCKNKHCDHRCIGRDGKETCVQKNKICDHNFECADKSDEAPTTCWKFGKQDRQCPFICPGATEYMCVVQHWICDGKYDCKESHADEAPKYPCPPNSNNGVRSFRDLLNELED